MYIAWLLIMKRDLSITAVILTANYIMKNIYLFEKWWGWIAVNPLAKYEFCCWKIYLKLIGEKDVKNFNCIRNQRDWKQEGENR